MTRRVSASYKVGGVTPATAMCDASPLLPSSCLRYAKRIAAVLTVRPKVQELAFHVYGRSLHPELFESHAVHQIARDEYQASLHVTSTGHVLTWNYRALHLTEVATAANVLLPQKRRLISYRLKGSRADRVECRGGARYQMNFQLEQVAPEIFWSFHHELLLDGSREGLLYRFAGGGRMELGAVSYLTFDATTQHLSVRSFHTFPDDYAIVKTQSLFELP